MKLRQILFAASLATTSVVGSASAQDSGLDPQRAMVTRAELVSKLAIIDKEVNATGYSQALRDARRAEGDAIRERLANGDLLVGDKIKMMVVGEPAFSGEKTVSALRTISFPTGDEIPVVGWLRSELKEKLTERVSKYLVDPTVTASSEIRITLSGGLAKNGFYYAPATDLFQHVIMDQGGGPRNADYSRSKVLRGDRTVIDGPAIVTAIHEGQTMDQMNIQAGDEIVIGEKKVSNGGVLTRALGILGAVGAAASGIYLLKTIF